MTHYIDEAEPYKEGPKEVRPVIEFPSVFDDHLKREFARRAIGIVSAFRERRMVLFQTIHLPRNHSGSFALVVLGEAIRAVLDEFEDAVLGSLD
jgi:hypothetical protein